MPKRIPHSHRYEASREQVLKDLLPQPARYPDTGAIVYTVLEDGSAVTVNTNLDWMLTAAEKALSAARDYHICTTAFRGEPSIVLLWSAYQELEDSFCELLALMELANIGLGKITGYIDQTKGFKVWSAALLLRTSILQLISRGLILSRNLKMHAPETDDIVIDPDGLIAMEYAIQSLRKSMAAPEKKGTILPDGPEPPNKFRWKGNIIPELRLAKTEYELLDYLRDHRTISFEDARDRIWDKKMKDVKDKSIVSFCSKLSTTLAEHGVTWNIGTSRNYITLSDS